MKFTSLVLCLQLWILGLVTGEFDVKAEVIGNVPLLIISLEHYSHKTI